MKKIILYVFLLLSTFVHLNAQEKVYMPLFEVLNMHPDYQYSTSKLFKTYLENITNYHVILSERDDIIMLNESIEEVRSTASELDCQYFIIGELNRLGDIVIITMSLYNTTDGEKIWYNTSKARTPEDIDPVFNQIALNIGNNDSSNNKDIYNVTRYESKELNKVRANKYFGVTIGGGHSFMPNINKSSLAGLGLVGSYDIRNVIFNIKAEAFFSDIAIYYFDIDAIYPLSSKKNSVFLSSGIGLGGVTLKNYDDPDGLDINSSGGLFLFAGSGYLLNRNSDVSLRFEGRAFCPLFSIEESIPYGVLFSASLLFGR